MVIIGILKVYLNKLTTLSLATGRGQKEENMDLVITILGWIALGVISAYLLAIIGKIIFDAATADYKLYKHVRLCRKRLLRQRYEDYAWLLFQLEKDTEVFNRCRFAL